jgi:hypothetical protein
MRIRTIKPGFWKSLSISELPLDARLHYIGLWNYADDEGRGVDNPLLLKAEIWPLDNVSVRKIEALQKRLADAGKILRYTDGTRRFFEVAHWSHQVISHPRPSELPGPDDSRVSPLDSPRQAGLFPEPSRNGAGRLPEASVMEVGSGSGSGSGSGREGGSNARASLEAGFVRFWNTYPIHNGGRANAHAKFITKVRAGIDPERIISGAQRFRDDPNRVPENTPYPTTWLNQERWDDPPLPPRGSKKPDPAADTLARAAALREQGR